MDAVLFLPFGGEVKLLLDSFGNIFKFLGKYNQKIPIFATKEKFMPYHNSCSCETSTISIDYY